MLKLNRINLKLQDFENKYIKNKQKSLSTSSSSDDSISYGSKISAAKSLGESEGNGILVDAPQDEGEPTKDKKPELDQKKLDPVPEVFKSHWDDDPKHSDSSETFKKPEIKFQSINRSNGHWDDPNPIIPSEIIIKPKIKSRPMNQSNTFDVLGNMRLITLDDLADDSNSFAASGKKRGDKIVPEPIIFQNDDRGSLGKESSVESLDSEIKSPSNNSRSASKIGVKMNGYNTESDIVEELISPVSDILEDISTALSNESFSSGPSEIKTEPLRRNNKKRSASVATNYDYSSEFEILSDAGQKQKSEQLNSRSILTDGSTGSKAPEEMDATTDNISELDQTQSYDQPSETIKEGSSQLISGPPSEQISERITSASNQQEFHAREKGGYSENDDRAEATKTEISEEEVTSKLDLKRSSDGDPHVSSISKSDGGKRRNYPSVGGDAKLQTETAGHFLKLQHPIDKVSYDVGKSKANASPNIQKSQKQKIKTDKSVSKMYKTNSKNLNNNGDSQKNSSTGSSKSGHAKVESSENTNNVALKAMTEPCEGKEAAVNVKRNRYIKRIKNDISSDSEMKNRNKIADTVNLKQEFIGSMKISENLPGEGREPKNLKSVNTQTSPKVVCFEESTRFETFEEKFKTSRENICSCYARNSGCFRNSKDSTLYENDHGRLETVMNHLLTGQLKFIQNMVERQTRSHELNRQIIQQMRLSQPNCSYRT